MTIVSFLFKIILHLFWHIFLFKQLCITYCFVFKAHPFMLLLGSSLTIVLYIFCRSMYCFFLYVGLDGKHPNGFSVCNNNNNGYC